MDADAGLTAEDERRITAVLMAYATGLDRRDWPLFASCFTEDAVTDYVGIFAYEGRDPFIAYMSNGIGKLGPTLHRVTNIVITGAGDRATATSYVDAVRLRAPGGTTVLHAIGHYEDELRAEGGVWRISKRRYVPLLNSTFVADA